MEYLRKEMGFTQEGLGRILGVSQALVSLIERGEYQPSPDLARKCAEFFRCPIQELQAPVRLVTKDEYDYLNLVKARQGGISILERNKREKANGAPLLPDKGETTLKDSLRGVQKRLRQLDRLFRQSFEAA